MQSEFYNVGNNGDSVYQGIKLFEIAWEVCNQVGGIYTVIRSKVPSVIQKCGIDNYFLLGPYFENQAAANFDEFQDYSGPVGQTVIKMRELGYEVHYGQWIVSGKPRVVLFNPYSIYGKLGEIKYFIWEHHHITLPDEDQLLNQVASFGFQVREFFRIMCELGGCDNQIIAHFHEWMAGLPIPGLRRDNLNIKPCSPPMPPCWADAIADNHFYEHLEFYTGRRANFFNVRPSWTLKEQQPRSTSFPRSVM